MGGRPLPTQVWFNQRLRSFGGEGRQVWLIGGLVSVGFRFFALQPERKLVQSGQLLGSMHVESAGRRSRGFPAGGLLLLALVAACGPSTGRLTTSSEAPTPPISDNERAELEAECARDQGFEAWTQGPVLFIDDGGQVQASEQAVETCMAEVEQRFPSDIAFDLTFEANRRMLYEELLKSKNCLEGLGYSISKPPTFDRFSEGLESDPWHPHLELLAHTGQAEWERLNEACPQPFVTVALRAVNDR